MPKKVYELQIYMALQMLLLSNLWVNQAFGCLVKWWRRDASGEYVLDSISNNPHTADVGEPRGATPDMLEKTVWLRGFFVDAKMFVGPKLAFSILSWFLLLKW